MWHNALEISDPHWGDEVTRWLRQQYHDKPIQDLAHVLKHYRYRYSYHLYEQDPEALKGLHYLQNRIKERKLEQLLGG